MPPLTSVYAYRDQGPLGPTRWVPRKTVCTFSPDHTDLPGELFAVKFCQGPQGAAAMISEVICRELFRMAGLHVLEAVIVVASETFARSWNENNANELPISAGLYFGTRYIPNPWGGSLESLEQAESPRDLALIWLIDCLVCNIDRDVRGNLMLLPIGATRKLRVLPADNSDCFGGSTEFSNGQWRNLMKLRRGARGILVPEAIAFMGGNIGLRIAHKTLRPAIGSIGAGFDQVPDQWWQAANLESIQIEEALWERYEALPELVNFEQWGGGYPDGNDGEIPLIQL